MAEELQADNHSVCIVPSATIDFPPSVRFCGDSEAVKVQPVFFYGAWETGPYFDNHTTSALRVWHIVHHLYQERSPDIFVISANLWDVARWALHHPRVLELTETGRQLFQQQLVLWRVQFARLLHSLQVYSCWCCWCSSTCMYTNTIHLNLKHPSAYAEGAL